MNKPITTTQYHKSLLAYKQYQQLSKREKSEEALRYLKEAADGGYSTACYEYARFVEQKDADAFLHYLHLASDRLHPPSIRLLIQHYKAQRDRHLRLCADHLILRAYGAGLKGYEYRVAHMLFEGLGFYSRLPLEHTNRRLAVQILLYEKDSPKRSLTLGEFLMDAQKPFVFQRAKDAELYTVPRALAHSSLPPSDQQAIQWLQKANCSKGYARIAQYYLEHKDKEQALTYYRAALSCQGEKKTTKEMKHLADALQDLLRPQSPEEKLAFLFYSEDTEHRLSVLKKALWAVTSEGYCRIMKETLEQGTYDPEAEEWKLLYSMKDDIQALYEHYQKMQQD